MNILNLSTLPLWDIDKGKGRVSTYLPIKGFVDKGHTITYITNNSAQKEGDFEGIHTKQITTPLAGKRPIILLLMYPVTVLCFLIAGIKQGRKIKPDVVYSHTTYTALPALIIAKLFGAKYVLRLYGNSYKKNRLKPGNFFTILSFWLKADLYILTDDGTSADRIALSFGVAKEKIHFLKNGINKKWSNYFPDDELKKCFAPNGEAVLLSVSRLADWKQVDWIIMAMPDILQLNSKVKLVIVGDGPDKKKLHDLTKELNMEHAVIFVGAVEQKRIYSYMNIGDIFISMNALSSLSNPVFEAMICGVPVVALNRGTTSQLIKNGVNGVLVEDNEIAELPVIIANLLKNEGERIEIGRNGQKTIMDDFFTWEERVKYEVELIENLVGNPA